MNLRSVLLRAAVALAAVIVIVLAGGTWIASAQGTIGPVPPHAGPIDKAGWDEILAHAPDWVIEHLENWFGVFAGESPCGFFETEWGLVNVSLENLEACQAAQGNLGVMCLNSQGQLVTNTVTNLGVTPDGNTLVVRSETRQHGHCGIFVQPGVGLPPGLVYSGPSIKAWDLTDPFRTSGDRRIENELPNWFGAFDEYTPCGFFTASWGSNAVSLATTEACVQMAGNLTVMCIGPDANLTQTTVAPGSVAVSADGETLYWLYTGRQDGHCGVFEAPAPAAAATGYIKPGIIR